METHVKLILVNNNYPGPRSTVTLLGEGDPRPTSAMEDGSELRLEVMRGRKECGKPWSIREKVR